MYFLLFWLIVWGRRTKESRKRMPTRFRKSKLVMSLIFVFGLILWFGHWDIVEETRLERFSYNISLFWRCFLFLCYFNFFSLFSLFFYFVKFESLIFYLLFRILTTGKNSFFSHSFDLIMFVESPARFSKTDSSILNFH